MIKKLDTDDPSGHVNSNERFEDRNRIGVSLKRVDLNKAQTSEQEYNNEDNVNMKMPLEEKSPNASDYVCPPVGVTSQFQSIVFQILKDAPVVPILW